MQPVRIDDAMHSLNNKLFVRESNQSDFESLVDYFLKADKNFLIALGVDIPKLPSRSEWLNLLESEYQQTDAQKIFFYVIWLLDGAPVGHSNINKIIFGESAYMHLHLWSAETRQKGMGVEFATLSLPYYFERFQIKILYCEPNALNHAPNNTLKKLGFQFIKQYETIPGWINSHQTVNRWSLDVDSYRRFVKSG